MKRVTLNAVNAALKTRFGEGVKLYRAAAYFYFAGPLVDRVKTTGVCVTRLSALTVDQWCDELSGKLSEAGDL